MAIVHIALLIIDAALALLLGYLLLLTAAACFAPRRTPQRGQSPTHRFIFLIPAHNEEYLLPSLLDSLGHLDYPSELYTVHVVADNCTDATAELSRRGGAITYERHDTTLIGKGYALQWLLRRIWESNEKHDAIIILDADTIISPNFLVVMDGRLARGERVIQAYYTVRTPDGSWGASLRAVAMAAWNFLRPLGRAQLGASAGLKGNGMVFAADVAQRYEWPASLTEDLEYHTKLILGGERATFAPDAQVWAEMPATLAAARTQQMRWERGRLETARHYIPLLLREALIRRSFLLFDAAVEQLIPPFSIIAAISVMSLTVALALRDGVGVGLAALILIGQVIYILAGVSLARVPRHVSRALLYAPIFIVWKFWMYGRVLIDRQQNSWIRTTRNHS